MKLSRKDRFYVGVMVLILSIVVYLMISASRLPEYSHARVLRYSFTVTNPSSMPIEYGDFWTYIPLKQTASQKRIAIRASHPYQLKEEANGNERMYFLLGTMAPYATKVINVDVEMRTATVPNSVPTPYIAEYLQAQRFIESDNEKIRNLGEELDAWRSSSAVNNIYEWISSNLVYAGYVADDMGARYALATKSGDCSEYAYLVTALSRTTGRYSRVMAGFVAQGSTLLQPAEYHNWSEVYFGGTWHLVDAQRGSYDKNYSDYIGFRVVNAAVAGSDTDFESQRLFGTDLPLSVKMNGKRFSQ